ncbi:MAG: aminotransferase class I/II-fold pyridoxal phosphate-dependent enzyme [Candidatus Latescibacteria bacterium]|nr:aminotransferase class I/II-fold pyridoxal phosphate-dependent enzyme [Candidatus Latescibacterota bacterium]
MIKARESVEQLAPYVAPLEGRRPMLRLDFNENILGPSSKVVEAIRQMPAQLYATYPEYEGLTQAYAGSLAIDANWVGAFNGADAAIRALFDAYGEAGSPFLCAVPSFGYYLPCAQQQGMAIEEVPYAADLSYPLAEIGQRLQEGPRLFFICNPNNPTTTLIAPQTIVDLARSAPDTLVVVDEIYAGFTGQSVVPLLAELDNVVVLRSLSKMAGMAALRMGFAVGHPTIIDRMTRVTGPYDINALAVAASFAALEDKDYIRCYVEQVAAAKSWTQEQFDQLGVRYMSQGGNYMLVWPPGDCQGVVQGLRERGILVRSMAGKPVIDGSFRLTVGPLEQMRQFMAAFQAIV